ncbi:hypothetical protein D3C83_174410 [compost metagenome]
MSARVSTAPRDTRYARANSGTWIVSNAFASTAASVDFPVDSGPKTLTRRA